MYRNVPFREQPRLVIETRKGWREREIEREREGERETEREKERGRERERLREGVCVEVRARQHRWEPFACHRV